MSTEFTESELVLGLVGPVGSDLGDAVRILSKRLVAPGYNTEVVHISKEIIPTLVRRNENGDVNEFDRTMHKMDDGDQARDDFKNNAILALGVAAKIHNRREKNADRRGYAIPKQCHIIKSLKHPDEVLELRRIYPRAFYLIAVHCDKSRQIGHLVRGSRMTTDQAERLMDRDENGDLPHGQRVADTFHMADFFVREDKSDLLEESLWRILDILFSNPHETPTFDEYAMHLAFSASLRSADLSRQVGAVVATPNGVLATGANDCPKFGGGLYWPELDKKTGRIENAPLGRDSERGEDANVAQQKRIIESIVELASDVRGISKSKLREVLYDSPICSLTEFGRSVHAEMEAILFCARSTVSLLGGTLFTTTFPCHNCAKHIIAAGISRVVYIEPYPKSLAFELHSDAISLGFYDKDESPERVCFEPFVGVGPRRFFDLFSLSLGSGKRLKRKCDNGKAIKWELEKGSLRLQMLPSSYLDAESVAVANLQDARRAHGLSI